MKKTKNILSGALLLLSCMAFGQLTVSPFNFNVSVDDYISIVAPENRVPAGGFTPLTQAVPIDVNIDGLGKIDSIFFGLHFLVGLSSSESNTLNLTGLAFDDDNLDYVGQTKHYLLRNEEKGTVIIELVIPCRNMKTGKDFEYNYQVIFNEANQSFSFHYGSDVSAFLTDENVYFTGVDVETVDFELLFFNYLYEDPSDPKVAKTVEDLENFNNLNLLPQIGTKYTFSNLLTSVGEQALLNKTRLEKTESGYRVYSDDKDLKVTLIDLNGKVLQSAKNYGSNYYFVNTNQVLNTGLYIIRMESKTGESAGYKIQL